MGVKLTEEEKKWVKSLKRLMKKCPKSFWFFSNGELTIMKYKKDGSFAGEETSRGFRYDQDYIVDSIKSRLFEGGGW